MESRRYRITCVTTAAAQQLAARLHADGVTRTGRDVTVVTDNPQWVWGEALLAYQAGVAESSSPTVEDLNGDDHA